MISLWTNNLRSPIFSAVSGATLMIAYQVAGKAARDGFFLQYYDVSSLPAIVLMAAIASVLMAVGFSRLTDRFGPKPLVPFCFALSAGLHLAEWALLPSAQRLIAAFVYLHVVGLGAILISGFWLLLSESFDVREAKQSFGRIAGAGIAGGVAGGLLAERLVAWFSSEPLLLLLAFFHFGAALASSRLRPLAKSKSEESDGTPQPGNPFTRTPMLWQLASLIFLATSSAALLDYLFKVGATSAIGSGPNLVRYFAVYHTACQILTFLFQTYFAQTAVERIGIANSIASLPIAIGLGSLSSLLLPYYPVVILARVAEVILRGSVFRSAYEFLYSPVSTGDKRSVKTIVDVGFDRLGDAFGAGAIQGMLWLSPMWIRPEILCLAIGLSCVALWLSLRLERSYRGVLENALVDHAHTADLRDINESLANTLFEGTPSLTNLRSAEPAQPSHAPELVCIQDPTIARMIELRSRDECKINRALDSSQSFDPLVVPQVIRLLAWAPVSLAAMQYLGRGGPRILGQIADSLRDQELDVAVRRRIPRLLARTGLQEAVDTLVGMLNDPRFEVRYQCGRALEELKRNQPLLEFHSDSIWAAAGRELRVGQGIWMSRRRTEDDPLAGGDFLDEVLRDRADRSLEHVFSLFALVLPRKPLIAAFRALHHSDKSYRGLALEYLEASLNPQIRDDLWVILEEAPAKLSAKDSEWNEAEKNLLDALIETNMRLLLNVGLTQSKEGDGGLAL